MTERTDLEATAHHEAGHAVVGLYLGLPLRGVSIVETDDAAGSAFFELPKWFDPYAVSGGAWTDREFRLLEKRAVMGWSGTLAEERFAGDQRSTGFGLVPLPDRSESVIMHGSDIGSLVQLAEWISYGPDEVDAFLQWTRRRSENLLDLRWSAVELVASALLESSKLSGARVRRLIAGSEMRDLAVEAERWRVQLAGRGVKQQPIAE